MIIQRPNRDLNHERTPNLVPTYLRARKSPGSCAKSRGLGIRRHTPSGPQALSVLVLGLAAAILVLLARTAWAWIVTTDGWTHDLLGNGGALLDFLRS